MHDVFHQAYLSEEGEVVAEWLKKRNMSYWSVASALNAAETSELLAERRKLNPDLDTPIHIHRGDANPMMFFVMR